MYYSALECSLVRNWRVNIIVLSKRNGLGIILDPNSRWKTNSITQDLAENDEKKILYLP